MKIKVKSLSPSVVKFDFISKGDWIDLHSVKDVIISAPQAGVQYEKDGNKFRDVSFEHILIPLGIAMQLPEGYEALVAVRSSTFSRYGIIQANAPGIIDNSYNGDEDEWKLSAIALNPGTVSIGDRICQFRIQLSQKATVWQKIKWLFTLKIKFVWVDHLNNKSRGGFGSTGK